MAFRTRPRAAALFAAPLAALLTATVPLPAASAATAPLTPAPVAAPHWTPCHAATECGTLRVPLDYSHPDRGTVALALTRVRATGPHPLGSLVVNFGGPGLSGITELAARKDDFAALNRRYDLIGFDPRGVSRSTPVDCGDLSAVTATSAADQARQIARACRAVSGPLLPWVGTPNAARDLDRVRAALGDDRLAYLGFSYGGRLGAVYAHEFPTHVGRFVLDGVPDPTLDDAGTALAQTRGFQRALTDFAADCARRAAACPLPGGTTAGVLATVSTAPGRLSDDGLLDRAGYVQAVENALYSKDNWPVLRRALAGLRTGNGDLMLRLAYPAAFGQAAGVRVPPTARALPASLTPPASPASPGSPRDNYQMAKLAIDCRDIPARRTPAQLDALDADFTAASPLFGHSVETTLLACTGWPPGDDAAREVSAPTAPQSLLVATTGDPATPYPGAGHMARALGNDSRVLTHRGEGHGAYFAHSPCVTAAVNAYLLDGALPAPGASC